jgi:hypothetical protein
VQRVALIWLNPLRTRARQHGVMNTPRSQVHAASPDLEIEAPVCYFNQEEFPLG